MRDTQFRSTIRIRLGLSRGIPAWPPTKRKPKGSAPALVEPPRGPLPLQGGAEAPLEFDA